MKKIEDLIKELPPEEQKEVEDFVRFLRRRKASPPGGNLKLDWRGALRDLREKYTSVELQHKLVEWWGD